MAQLHPDVQKAIQSANDAGWKWRRSNKLVIIVPPGLAPLSVGERPNDQTLREWRSTCRTFNLTGDGPARIPAELLPKPELEAKKPSPSPEQVRKATEKAQAAKKAQDVVEQAMKMPPAPQSPTTPVFTESVKKVEPKPSAAPKPKADSDRDADGFPPFTEAMLAFNDYADYKLPDGQYFCPICWKDGIKKFIKAPQGIASHRSFSHKGFGLITGVDADLSKLPKDIATAITLLIGTISESEPDSHAAEEVTKLQKELAGRSTEIADLTKKLDDLRKNLAKAEGLAAQRGSALDAEKARHQTELKQLVGSLENDLKVISELCNNERPVVAVGKIDEIVRKYVGK